MLWEKLVDTPVRGVVYEGEFEELSRQSSERWQIPLELGDPFEGVKRLLGV
jgi:hypothetical protein